MRYPQLKTFSKIILIASLLFSLFVTSVQTVTAQEIIAPSETVFGTLSDENYTDWWYFEAAEGDVLTANMIVTSGDLDPYIDLWYQSGDNMEKLAFDDDSGYNSNARIADYTLPYSGQYVLGSHRYDKIDGSTHGDYRFTFELIRIEPLADAPITADEAAIQINDVWEYTFLGGDCPMPGYCLPYDTFQWLNTNLSYCIADADGIWLGDARHSFYLFGEHPAATADLNASVAAALAYWSSETGFEFRERNCNGNPDIMIGFADPYDMQKMAPTASEGTKSYALNISENHRRILILVNNTNVNWDIEDGGYALDFDLAHQIGHALGISHDPVEQTTMHANLTPDDRLETITLGEDSQAQLFSLYPEAVDWEGAKQGFIQSETDIITAFAGETVSVTVPYPLGANNVLPLCAIEIYQELDTDAEFLGWTCTWEVDPINRQVTFDLIPHASTNGVSATAVLIDTDVFNLLHLYHFTAPAIDGDEDETATYYDVLNNDEIVIPAFEYVISDNALPIITITEYISTPDTPLTFSAGIDLTVPEATVISQGGDADSMVGGYIAILQPIGDSFAARCITEDPTCISFELMPDWQTISFGTMTSYDPQAVGMFDVIYLQIP